MNKLIKYLDFIPMILVLLITIALYNHAQQREIENKSIKQQLLECGIRIH